MQTENQKRYKEFIEEVKSAVEREIGEPVVIRKVNKNNGITLEGLTIYAEGVNISPTIYLNEYFEEYLSEGCDAVAQMIVKAYEEHKPKESVDLSFFMDVDRVQSKIRIKLINYEKNKELLERVPYVRFHDLAVVFVVVLESYYEGGLYTILIYNHQLAYWGMCDIDLYNLAMQNTVKEFQLIPINKILCDFMDEESADLLMGESGTKICILTNGIRMYGAAGILHKEVLDYYMETRSVDNIWIIPSSIHETLLIPCDLMPDAEYVKGMVKEVNATQVQPEEILSDNVYVYDGNEITIAE